MGSELLGESASQSDRAECTEHSAHSYTEVFFQSLPYYLAMGMSADEFWNCDPRTYRAYREKQKIQNKTENQQAWLQGLYIYSAILSCAPRLNSFSPSKPDNYIEKPFDLYLDKAKEEKPIEITKTKGYVSMLEWANQVNRKRKHE